MSRNHFEIGKRHILDSAFNRYMKDAERMMMELKHIDKDDDGKLSGHMGFDTSRDLVRSVFERIINEMKG